MDWRILLLENFFIFASVVVHVVIEQTRTDENKLSTNIVVQKKITAYSTKSRCCVVYACLKTVSRRVVFFVEYGLDMATADVDAAIS